MAIKKSISGMRGTIGGAVGENLTPIDLVEMTAAYASWLKDSGRSAKVVVGRDGRVSGAMVSALAINTLISMGIDVVDLGYSTTPTVEIAVPIENAGGGIIFSASHNPKGWNALKLLNDKGEFISQADGAKILEIATARSFVFSKVEELGTITKSDIYIKKHIDQILALPIIDVKAIKARQFKVVVDCINSTGAIAIPPLLAALNCEYELLNEEVTGEFAHTPEPVPKNLQQLSEKVKSSEADFGIAVDPDVDRLVLVCEDGSMFSEEYTIVAAADFVLSKTPGNTVSNMSSTRALADLTSSYGGRYEASAVGEVNVVLKMKEINAVIGGEGNGGVIYPDLHYGRDALVGIAFIFNLLVDKSKSLSALKLEYPHYQIVKEAFEIDPKEDVEAILNKVEKAYLNERINRTDGLKLELSDSWVHIRSSNTEPLLRIIAEAESKEKAEALVQHVKAIIYEEPS